MQDSWNPKQYEQFKNERSKPFFDLIELIQPRKIDKAIDLGCGTGELTKVFHERFECKSTLGTDNSSNMLTMAQTHATSSLKFENASIENFFSPGTYDVIISNAAIQWCNNHSKIFKNIRDSLTKHGQIAIQMPMNHDYPTHVIAHDIALEKPFSEYLNTTEGEKKKNSMLKAEEYAEILFDLGFKEQKVFTQVYGHVLNSRESVIEWVKGTMLTYYQSNLPAEVYPLFMMRFKEELFKVLPDKQPFFYPFKRIFIWGSV